jgi:uncharacterized protein (TIGR02597 family)
MKSLKYLATISAMALSSAMAATTDAVGFVSLTIKANSDATIAVPLNRAPVFKGMIQSISGSTITVAGTPAWTAAPMQFVQSIPTQVNTYAIQLASGTKEGMTAKIISNTVNTVTIQFEAGDDLSGVVPEDADGITGNGDQIDIVPYWTPASLFSVVPPVGLELSGFEAAGAGINFGASELYTHVGANDWEDGINGGSSPHTPLRFGSAFVARNNSGSDYSATFVGAVPMTTCRIRLSTKAGGLAQDQYIGYLSPIPEPFATIANPNALGFPAEVGDTIQGFDNNVAGINKGADEIYVWTGTAWEDGINGGDVSPGVQGLKPGFGYIFQKAATANPTSVVWVHTPGYLQ